MLSGKAKLEIKTLMAKYPVQRSAIMGALRIAQREYGWLPDEALQELADLLGLSKTEVGSIASFYTMYTREQPGRHAAFLCTDLPCALAGADALLEHIEHKLGCQVRETTADGKITLRDAECLGGCDHAPVMLIDGTEHQQDLTNEKVDAIFDRLAES